MKKLLFIVLLLNTLCGAVKADHLPGLGLNPRPWSRPMLPSWGPYPYPGGLFGRPSPDWSLYFWHQHQERERKNKLLQLQLIFMIIQSSYNSQSYY